MRNSRLAAILLAHLLRRHFAHNFQSVRKSAIRDIAVNGHSTGKVKYGSPSHPDDRQAGSSVLASQTLGNAPFSCARRIRPHQRRRSQRQPFLETRNPIRQISTGKVLTRLLN